MFSTICLVAFILFFCSHRWENIVRYSNLLFGLIGPFDLLKDVNIAFFFSFQLWISDVHSKAMGLNVALSQFVPIATLLDRNNNLQNLFCYTNISLTLKYLNTHFIYKECPKHFIMSFRMLVFQNLSRNTLDS